jgi:hypothetical protein
MSHARRLCGLTSALLVGLALAGGCSTAPAPVPAAPVPVPPPAATPAAAGPGTGEAAGGSAAAAGGAASGSPTPGQQVGTAAPGPAAAGAPAKRDGQPNVEMTEVNERTWLANLRKKLGEKLGADPADFRLSPRKQLVAFVRSPPPHVLPAAASPAAGKKKSKRPPPPPPPRKHQIIVADLEGKVQATFRPLVVRGSDEPPKDLRFLTDTSLIYEVTKPPPAPVVAKSAPRSHPAHAAAKHKPATPVAAAAPIVPVPPLSEQRLFVVQPIGKRPRPIRCEGWAFTWNPPKDHLAYVAGTVGRTFVAVDGARMYPRKGQTIIASDPAWSKDGTSLAFLELRPAKPARLVLLAEFDNPTGDTIWELPANLTLEGSQVFWANHGKLVVGKSVLKPVFATPFTKEPPRKFDP